MELIRKPIGLLIIAFIGFPALYVVTWTVGITRAVSQPDFIPSLPEKISEELPGTVDLLFDAAINPRALKDKNARTWITAAAEAETRPGELLEEIGFLEWLREDLSKSLVQIFDTMNGEIHPEIITLDFRLLKRAVEHEAIDRYFLEVVDKLPPCTPQQQAAWEAIGAGKRYSRRSHRNGLPAAKPDQATIRMMAWKLKDRRMDMPDEVVLFHRDEFQLPALDLFSIAFMLSLGLFLIPGFFIAFGAFVAEPFSFRSFRWSGVAVTLGGLAVMLSAILPKLILKGSLALIEWVGLQQHEPAFYWPPELISEVTDRIYSLFLTVIDPLFSPVLITALIVSVCGLVLCTISVVAQKSTIPEGRPAIPRDG